MKHLPTIEVFTLKHNNQNYDTCGDYGEYENQWLVSISELSKWEYESLVLIHELVEMILTKKRRINWDKITKFDKDNPGLSEPGMSPKAPYHKEHMFATKIERLLAKELGVDWKKYDEAIDKLKY